MIKKLLMILCAATPVVAGAQVVEKYPGVQLTRFSDNGRFVAVSWGGFIYDRQTGKSIEHDFNYALGLGPVISDDGIMVGSSTDFTTAAYGKDGKWQPLPNNVAPSVSYARADGITPDGKRIVGTMDCRLLTRKQWPMVSPVIWTWNEQTEAYEFEILPTPEFDITTCLPQQITASYISRDGKTVFGQVIDYRGLLTYQIVFRQAEDGTWSFENSGDKRLIKEGATWPEYPVRPTKPQPEDYLTNDELAAYDQAYREYEEALEIVDLTGVYPRLPLLTDFIKEKKDEYDEDMDKYNADSSDYLTKLRTFQEAYAKNLTNDVYELNSSKMSSNGKYFGANYIYSGPATGGDKAPTYISPIIYTHDGSSPDRVIESPSMGLLSVCDDGTLVTCTPKSDENVFSRTPYLVPLGEEPVLYADWVRENYPTVYEWMRENLVYDIEAADSESGQLEKDVMLCGSVRLNSDKTKAIAYFLEPGKNSYVSYVVDFTAEPGSGLETALREAEVAVYPNPTTDALFFTAAPDRVELYAATGTLLYAGAPGRSLALKALGASGLCFVKITKDNATVTRKVVVR